MYQTQGKYGKYRRQQYVNTGMQISAVFMRDTAKIDNFLMNKSDILSHCNSKQSIVQNYVISIKAERTVRQLIELKVRINIKHCASLLP